MNFTFNSNQANELINRLQLGQIIKVQVLEKTSNSHYLISYKNLQLTAASEVDLFAKSVWLRVTQKVPYPKLQIIIEEEHGNINELFEYADQNSLSIPSISKQLKDFIACYEGGVPIHDLYYFINWYSEKVACGVFSDFDLLFLLNKGIAFGDLMLAYDDFYLQVPKSDVQDALLDVKLLSTAEDIVGISIREKLAPKIALIETINSYLCEHNIKLSLLYIRHSWLTLVTPVKSFINGFTGLINTKHFGRISFRYEPFIDKTNISLVFESMLYMNSLKPNLMTSIDNNKINLLMSVQSISNAQVNLHNEWSYVV